MPLRKHTIVWRRAHADVAHCSTLSRAPVPLKLRQMHYKAHVADMHSAKAGSRIWLAISLQRGAVGAGTTQLPAGYCLGGTT